HCTENLPQPVRVWKPLVPTPGYPPSDRVREEIKHQNLLAELEQKPGGGSLLVSYHPERMNLSQIDLGDSRLFDLLWKCDQELAKVAKADAGGICAACGGALHQGNFPRKPRGGRGLLGPEYKLRLSFCCSTDGCRKRLTPP